MGITRIARTALIVVGLAAGSAHAEQRGDLIERDDEPLLFPEPAARREPALPLSRPAVAAIGAGIVGGAAVVVSGTAIVVDAISGAPRASIIVPPAAAVLSVLAAPVVVSLMTNEPQGWQSSILVGTTLGAGVVGLVGGAAAGGAIYMANHSAIANALGYKGGDGGLGAVTCMGLGASVGVLATTTTTAAITTTLLGVE